MTWIPPENGGPPPQVEECAMVTRRAKVAVLVAGVVASMAASDCLAQCCLEGLFAGCGSCFRKAPPAYAVAPVMAPIAAPIAAPPPPVMVPVQQVSYVPETTYQTKYECVPVTSYKPTCEIDPCTGCARECMEQVVNYQQRPVSVPVTQYRAVYSTKYVQRQPGYQAQGAYPAAASPPPAFTAPPAASPFAAPVQTAPPQGWIPAGSDAQQLAPGPSAFSAPALPPVAAPQSTFQQQIVPQSGMVTSPVPSQPPLQPTSPPALSPAPSLKPIPEMPRVAPRNAQPEAGKAATGTAGEPPASQPAGPAASSSLTPIQPWAVPAATPGGAGVGMPVMPGPGPGPATGAFPKLLEPTGHTTHYQPPAAAPAQWQSAVAPQTIWQPSVPVSPGAAYAAGHRAGGYPTAALPIRSQQ
jgi:hypothetical protein